MLKRSWQQLERNLSATGSRANKRGTITTKKKILIQMKTGTAMAVPAVPVAPALHVTAGS